MTSDLNPLLDFSGLPRFDAIRPEHVAPALDVLLAEADAALQCATSDATPADYDALSSVLDVALDRLNRAWGAVNHLHGVADTPELRAAYTAQLPRVVEFQTRLGADEKLYAKYKAIAASPAARDLAPARRRALDNALRDFVLSGAELQGEARETFTKLQDEQAEWSQKFSEHILDATDGWSMLATAEQLAGVPDDVIAAMRAAAEADGADGYKITLKFPVYLPVMQYATDRNLRETVYTAYVTRASEFGPPERDNAEAMQRLLDLRQQEAQLLGYRRYADLSLVPKMAASPEEVLTFLRDLAKRARPSAEADLAELADFARRELGIDELQAWDMSFASERLKEARYAFSEQDVKLYFTEPKVLEGLFGIVEKLFEVTIRPDEAPVWNEGVRFFRVERPVGDTTRLVGQFYLDPYARAGKRSGAWMGDARNRWKRPDGALQTPVAYLVCNFAAPVDGKPALLTHDDVTTLFHEFGHGLHHMLTQVDEIAVSGISGVEWDAVELPSQFMENFCWEWEVVRRMTAHVDSGEPLPRALFDKMLAAKNFQSGLQTLRQVEFSLIDMRLHADAGSSARIQALADEVREEVAVVRPPTFNRFLNSFSHIFSGGYSAGYYSYKWAEVLSADAWSAFEEAANGPDGVLDVATGRRFRENVLEVGGSRPALDSFVAFRGRAPTIDALLRHQGLAA
ncbi:M3 family metallopeptidase [Piscinibacter koreensis]|uniref:oligopeptidase A n=1 Tax=Piscinibacter koreensis TaxID=2742824 RepID=A0A7Y6NL30_9BURK|nr:M3 family metallopeptidase [Schlegelella koreensis]NUZ05066.1 M3 family metallopeptidase [Schlegelella koreensis]